MDPLADIFHRRWAVPVLAELGRSRGAKFISLVRRLDASEGAMRAALDDLIERGLVVRNPGYGHPLRPEYILTEDGDRAAPACASLLGELGRLGAVGVGLKKWPMPVLHAVGDGPARFSDLAGRLPGATDRALALSLRDLDAARLVARSLRDGRPPFAVYSATPHGRRLTPILQDLAAA